MQVIFKYPEDMETFEDNFALFHATLLVGAVKKYDISSKDKKRVFNGILKKLKQDMEKEKKLVARAIGFFCGV
jgi:hypothetical protein